MYSLIERKRGITRLYQYEISIFPIDLGVPEAAILFFDGYRYKGLMKKLYPSKFLNLGHTPFIVQGLKECV